MNTYKVEGIAGDMTLSLLIEADLFTISEGVAHFYTDGELITTVPAHAVVITKLADK